MIDLANAVGRADSWSDVRAAVESGREPFLAESSARCLQALMVLYPGFRGPALLLELLTDARARGLEAVLESQQEAADRRSLLEAWIATRTWTESETFLADHHAELDRPEIRQLLDPSDDTAAQHLAILDLSRTIPTFVVYRIVIDASFAEDTALSVIQSARLDQLVLIWAAAIKTKWQGAVLGLVAAVLAIVGKRVDEARAAAEATRGAATEKQCQAHLVRLRSLRSLRPDLAGLDEVIAILEAPRPAQPDHQQSSAG